MPSGVWGSRLGKFCGSTVFGEMYFCGFLFVSGHCREFDCFLYCNNLCSIFIPILILQRGVLILGFWTLLRLLLIVRCFGGILQMIEFTGIYFISFRIQFGIDSQPP